jgi:hypothetical protein
MPILCALESLRLCVEFLFVAARRAVSAVPSSTHSPRGISAKSSRFFTLLAAFSAFPQNYFYNGPSQNPAIPSQNTSHQPLQTKIKNANRSHRGNDKFFGLCCNRNMNAISSTMSMRPRASLESSIHALILPISPMGHIPTTRQNLPSESPPVKPSQSQSNHKKAFLTAKTQCQHPLPAMPSSPSAAKTDRKLTGLVPAMETFVPVNYRLSTGYGQLWSVMVGYGSFPPISGQRTHVLCTT